MTEIMEELKSEQGGSNGQKKTFALIVRGQPEDFAYLIDHARAIGLYVVYSKTSSLKIVLKEVPF